MSRVPVFASPAITIVLLEIIILQQGKLLAESNEDPYCNTNCHELEWMDFDYSFRYQQKLGQNLDDYILLL